MDTCCTRAPIQTNSQLMCVHVQTLLWVVSVHVLNHTAVGSLLGSHIIVQLWWTLADMSLLSQAKKKKKKSMSNSPEGDKLSLLVSSSAPSAFM